jgi:proteasome lid subunit RPN8/RPN11
MAVQILSGAIKDIHTIAEKSYPYECCGFIYGSVEMNEVKVAQAKEVINDSDENKKVHYTIPPKEFMKAERYALENDLQLIGVFHSHPDHPPKPSGRDLADALPELSYFITSVHQGQALDTRSWRLTDDRLFTEEPIEIHYQNN